MPPSMKGACLVLVSRPCVHYILADPIPTSIGTWMLLRSLRARGSERISPFRSRVHLVTQNSLRYRFDILKSNPNRCSNGIFHIDEFLLHNFLYYNLYVYQLVFISPMILAWRGPTFECRLWDDDKRVVAVGRIDGVEGTPTEVISGLGGISLGTM